MVKFNSAAGIQGAAGGFLTGGPLGAVAGGLLGGFAFGGGDSKNSASRRALWLWNKQFEKQTEWEKWKMKNAHQLEMDDLAKAGFNPVLTTGTGGAMNASAPSPSMSESILSGTIENNKVNSALRAQEVFNNLKRISAEIQNINEDTTNKALNNKLVEKYGDKEKKEQIANTIQQTQLEKANSALVNQKTQTEIINTLTGAANLPREMTTAKFYEEHPILGMVATGFREMSPVVNSFLGGAGMITSAKKFGEIQKQMERRQNLMERRQNFNEATTNRKFNTITKTERYNSKGVHMGTTYKSFR